MKNTKNAKIMKSNGSTKYLMLMAVLLATLLLPQGLRAQEDARGSFTLTNGTQKWLEGPQGSATVSDNAFDTTVLIDGDYKPLYQTSLTPKTLKLDAGTIYAAIDTATQSDHVTMVDNSVKAVTDFSPFCVWNRTGYTGYYYQEHTDATSKRTYRYYLLGSSTEGLYVNKVEVGDPLQKSTYWYNWDHGAAVTESQDGVRSRYYWLMYDDVDENNSGETARWRMSGHSYQRPEDIVYNGTPYDEDHVHYSDEVELSNGTRVPSGNGALYMPVYVTHYPKANAVVPAGCGLNDSETGLIEYDGGGAFPGSMKYGKEYRINFNDLGISDAGVEVQVRRGYVEYREELKRYYMNLSYRNRSTDGFNVYGIVPEGGIRSYYYYDDDATRTRYNAPLTGNDALATEMLYVADTQYLLDPASRRYLDITKRRDGSDNYATIRCKAIPPNANAILKIIVNYTNGTSDTSNLVIPMQHDVNKGPDKKPENAPVVYGYVVGGGRMAAVGTVDEAGESHDGNTRITIHNADTLYAVYGGNDIAGWVQGGSRIQIGTKHTAYRLPIGYVYGGGCGFYTYQGINRGHDSETDTWFDPYVHTGKPSLMYQAYYFNGKVYAWNSVPADYETYADTPANTANASWEEDSLVVDHVFQFTPAIGRPDEVDQSETGIEGDGTIPYIKSAHIDVGVREVDAPSDYYVYNDFIKIDSLFGGAENSFIGVTANEYETPHKAINIDIYGGTIYAVFGGNNYGGSVANTATVITDVYDTKLTGLKGIENTMFTGYGYDFGIRYLYGGGNMVDGSHGVLNIFGGMVDTCYLGGNQATVNRPIGTIACMRTGTQDRFGNNGHFIFENDYFHTPINYGADFNEATDRIQYTGNTFAFEAGNANIRSEFRSDQEYIDKWIDTTVDLSKDSIYVTYYSRTPDTADNCINIDPGNWGDEIGRYNVRAFFGGNNQAAMNTLSTLNLFSGGVSYVYGGGNAGDMNNDITLIQMDSINPRLHMVDSMIRGLTDWDFGLPHKIGTIVHSVPNAKIIVENVYGGCRMANVKNSSLVWLSGGAFGYVHGGCDISGDVGSEAVRVTTYEEGGVTKHDTIDAKEGTWVVLDHNVVVMQDVYGGSDGYYHCHENGRYKDPGGLEQEVVSYNLEPYDPYNDYVGMLVPTHNHSNLYIHGGTVLYAAYGGGVMTNVGSKEGNDYIKINGVERPLKCKAKSGTVRFLMDGGTIGSSKFLGAGNGDGNAYGGGYLSSVYGLSYTFVKDGSKILGSLYAGNDCVGSIENFLSYHRDADDSYVFHSDVYDIDYNRPVEAIAESDFYATDMATRLNEQDDHGKWQSKYSAYLRIEGTPTIRSVYGSGNGAYDYDGTHPEYSDMEPVCLDGSDVDNNRPYQSSTFVDIHTSGGTIDTVFGGGNGVGVRDRDGLVVMLNCTTPEVNTVGNIFGGNNVYDMASCVPDLRLLQGTVRQNVFGGGNAGNMNGVAERYSVCGDTVIVSTYVRIESENINILGDVYGGCNMADVDNMAYVDIRNTQKGAGKGLNNVYGGNNVSGQVWGNTRVDISDGQVKAIYGGSNGKFDYYEVADGQYNIYPYAESDTAGKIIASFASMPDVSTTQVNVYGGKIGDLYGGGRMGNCGVTNVLVNDHVGCAGTGGAVITGHLFGGGEGEWGDLNKPRRGNVTDSSNVILAHADTLTGAKAYGGGRGGNVYNTHITVTSDWDSPFQEIYGGCWGSDVFGTAHLDMDGKELGGAQNAHTVYGGNDFTGNVYKSVVNINSGKYGSIFGAGNGNYLTSEYNPSDDESPYYGTHRLYVPNNEYVIVNFNGGHVDSNLYGGGRFGTTLAYQKDDFGDYIFEPTLLAEGIQRRIADTTLDVAHAYTNPKDYSYIIVNVHGGTFDRNIFAGAAGRSEQLVYGFKMLNMDGGKVTESIYGGSESVHDGYPNECTGAGANESTERPSSVLNITGGEVRSSVYGGGYKGNTYGSAYINVGVDAIDSCVLWNKTINGTANAYSIFKPAVTGTYVHALTKDTLILRHSIYGGANWGTNEGKFDFRVKGFYGGESRILVDGNGYNTANSVTKPEMHIANSIIGSGTSVTGGDILNRIDVLNYGEVDPTNCEPTKELRSIQRADELWLHNTAIKYMGASDAVSAYPSQNLTINRVDQVNIWGYNVLGIAALMTEIGEVNFYKEELENGNFVLTTPVDLHIPYGTPCDPTATFCTKLEEAANRQLAAVVVYDGVNIEITTSDNGYGEVNGYGYFVAEDGTNAVITADAKYSGHEDGGGFISTCAEENRIPYVTSEGVSWADATSDNNSVEFVYNNYGTQYRVWSLGEGRRSRYAVILAHSNPHMLNEFVETGDRDYDDTIRFNKTIRVQGQDGKYYNLTLAHAQLILPPTDKNHYYKLASAVDLDDNNKSMQLVDTTWNPDHWNTTSSTDADSIKNNDWESVETAGVWYALPHVAGSSGFMGGNDILANPSSTFGFMLASGKNFKTTGPTGEADYNGGEAAFAGNIHVTEDKFVSNYVSDNPNASPIIDLYLTYSNMFSNTMLGTIKFSLQEMDGSDPSNPTAVNDPIEITVTVATILEEIRSMEHTVLAMYNEGRSNTFTRRAVLPATLQHRYIYLDGIEWYPQNCSENKFKLTGDHSNVIGTDNVFGISIEPVDEVSEDVTSTKGWHSIDIPKTDIYALAKDPDDGIDKYSYMTDAGCASHEPITLTGKGRKVGELDGRGLAALKIELFFDGNMVYDNIECVGKAKLYMKTYTSQEEGALPVDDFVITVNVKTRDKADTIYVAPGATYTYTKCDGTTDTYTAHSPNEASTDIEVGKRPSKYMRTFSDAFHPKVYQEGDVIAIMETMPVESKLILKGTDYANVPIIRYTGSHDDAQGEANVNRGTLIEVRNTAGSDGYLITRNVTFDGGAVSKIKLCDNAVNTVYRQYYNHVNYNKYETTAIPGDSIELKRVDTTASYGPIISVTGDGAKVLFEMGTYVENNYNALTTDSDPSLLGAVSVTDGALLMLEDQNHFRNNITVDFRTDDNHPVNGALYVKDASVKLMPSIKTTYKSITDNYLMPKTKNQVFWKDYTANVGGVDKRLRYVVDSLNIDNRANVYLTRTDGGSDMEDDITDIFDITDCGQLSASTKIGVTKWFPGPTERDTIQIAYQARGSALSNLNNNKNNFISDEGYKVIYEYDIDNRIIYLYRCASFRHQIAGELLPVPSTVTTDLPSSNPLDYLLDPYTACPGGTDRMVYHVQGGFLPYTYEWYSRDADNNLTLLRTRETEYGNLEVDEDLQNDDTYKYEQSVTDTLRLPSLSMTHNQNSATARYRVTASDQFGYCSVSKDIDIAISRAFDGENTFTAGAGWTDTLRGSSAAATRTYKAIQVTPKVWVDRSYGVVKSRIPGIDTIYSTDVSPDGEGHYPRLEDLYFCEGDVVTLHARNKLDDAGHPKGNFIMWDFDPYYSPDVRYVVPAESREVIAYYGPNEYWKDHIDASSKAGVVYDDNYTYDFTSRPSVSGYTSNDATDGAGYVVTYNGDVHIYDENGLAWFISQVNGYNQQQARTFRYNKVFLHQKSGGYDMQDYLWTPVGTLQHPFRGQFMGVAANDTARLTDDTVMIKNIIVNEPNVDYTGFFGFLDTARVFNIGLQGVMSRGSQYVGALAAKSNMSVIDECAVRDSSSANNGPLTTILVTHYVSGGMIGLSNSDVITNSTVYAKFVGDAVYSGGVLGYGTSSTFTNNKGRNISRMNGVYIGGLAGYLDGVAPHNGLFRHKSGAPSRVQNNYLHLVTDGGSQRVGGIVGYAKNSIIENNYVYGDIEGTMIAAGVGAELGNGAAADKNYYVDGSAKYAVGQTEGNAVAGDAATFQGSGNAVALNHNVSGVNNLTRVLNIWVREHNANGEQTYNTWRSDLDGVNDGYPLFGEPDLIPVVANRTVEDCEQVEWDGIFYTTDTTVSFNYIDSLLMVDSTLNLNIIIHHGTQTYYTDSAMVEDGYEGYGFSVSPAEAELLRSTIDSMGYATLVLSDTLSGAWGCDSVVTITLTFTAAQGLTDIKPQSEVKVYPNPTMSFVNVEATGMSRLELYDNEGRRLANYSAEGDHITIDVAPYPTGIYYIRIHTPSGITIQKVIKK